MVAGPNRKSSEKSRTVAAEPLPETPDQATRHQDTYRKVLFGQVADPIFPATSVPAELSDEELAVRALGDRGFRPRNARRNVPTMWPLLSLVILGCLLLTWVLR